MPLFRSTFQLLCSNRMTDSKILTDENMAELFVVWEIFDVDHATGD